MGSVLVTGGAGYIGSHAVKALTRAGQSVVVLDNLVAGHREAVGPVPFVQADIADTETVRQTIRQYDVSAVMHFAALLSVGESVSHPGRYYQVNVAGALSLLDAMVSETVRHLVFSSTCAIFGQPLETPIPEDHPTQPISAYGETKLAVERALGHYERAHGLRAIRFRYFNAAGADPEGEIGEDHAPEIHLIPNAIRAADTGAVLDIYGDDYPTPDGTCQRDYVHVSDLATAHVLALEALQSGGPSTAYNLGNGRPYSVREVVSAVERVSGSLVHTRTADRRPGDPAVLYASSDRAKRELRWAPQYEDIDAIVGTALRWHRSHPKGFATAPSVDQVFA